MIPASRAQFGEDSHGPSEQRVLWEHQTPIERGTGLRKDVRGPEITLFRDRRISRHAWVIQWLLKPTKLLLVCLFMWGPVRSLNGKPTPSCGLRRPCFINR